VVIVVSEAPPEGIESHAAPFELAGAARLRLDRRIALVDQSYEIREQRRVDREIAGIYEDSGRAALP
jgi:hypothetical protein